MTAATLNEIINSCTNLERIDFFIPIDQLSVVRFEALLRLKELNLLGLSTLAKKGQEKCFSLLFNRLPASLEKLTGVRSIEDHQQLSTFLSCIQ